MRHVVIAPSNGVYFGMVKDPISPVPPPIGRYAVAVFITACALVLTLGMGPVMARNPFLLLVAAVVASAWRGGLGPGLLSSALAAFGSAFFLLRQDYSMFTVFAEEGARLSVFLFVAILVNVAFDSRRRAEVRLQKREQQEQVIFDSVHAMIWYKDKDNRILRANKAAADSMGLQVKDVEGKSTYDLYPEEATRYYQADLKVIRTGQPKLGIVEPYRKTSGEKRWVRTDKIPYRDDNGDIIGVIVFAVDITERVQAEEALQNAYAGLELLVEERTRSLAQANEALRAQIQERLRAEEALKTAHADLERKVGERTTELAQANEGLRQSRERFRALAEHQQFVREEERTRIAREIHDELGQALTGLKMDLAWLTNRLPDMKGAAALREKAIAMAESITHTIEQVREISSDLRPGVLDQLGLVAAIEWQAHAFHKRSGIACLFRPPEKELAVDQARSTALFRMLQEALTNVARHADATQVTIRLAQETHEIHLDIADNGVGISQASQASPRSFGIMGMRERALALGGTLHIEGTTGKGTIVRVRVPA